MMLGEYDSSEMIAARPRANWLFFTLYVFSFTLLVMNCSECRVPVGCGDGPNTLVAREHELTGILLAYTRSCCYPPYTCGPVIAILTSAFDNVKLALRSTPSYTSESFVYRTYKSFVLLCFRLEEDSRFGNIITCLCKCCCCCCSGARAFRSPEDDTVLEIRTGDDDDDDEDDDDSNGSDSFKVRHSDRSKSSGRDARIEEMIRNSSTGGKIFGVFDVPFSYEVRLFSLSPHRLLSLAATRNSSNTTLHRTSRPRKPSWSA